MERLSWRALRPLLLAGAAAAAWLTLSAPGASADAASDPGSLLGGVSSSVSSVTEAATSPVQPTELVQPLTGPVDHLIAAVPLVNQVVPSGTVGAVTTPVSEAADGIVAEIAKDVLPAVSDALPVLDPVLEPVLEPVGDLLAGVEALPGNIAVPVPTVPAAAPAATAGSVAPELILPVRADAESTVGLPAPDVASKSVAPLADAGPGTPRAVPLQEENLESPRPYEGDPGPSEIPAVPGSGSGSSQSSGGAAGGIAWLSTVHLDVPLTGALPVSGPLQNAPAPVSFDPGSSPD